ncbi:MAG: SH3 domain-containing protein [Polymorphobacter sp.]|uniref:SH3 domain-containing protein n=1 Tax=Polymorphobacter sp. TaxID=1909290 RepID=UPI003A87DA78
MSRLSLALVSIAAAGLAVPAHAAKEPPVELVTCETPIGTVAVVDGDTQGWAKYGLGSPRPIITALSIKSGCFQMHNPAGTTPANYLMNVIAGDKEEIDQAVEIGKSVAMEGMIRSGAAGGLLGSVPGGGAVLGMFGGFGGKKKTYAAGIRLISPANGMTMVAGTGEVKKSTINFSNIGWANEGLSAAGYNSKEGQALTEAFIKAFNAVVAQRSALQTIAAATAPAVAAQAPAAPAATPTSTPTGSN